MIRGPLTVQPRLRGDGFDQQLMREGMPRVEKGPWRLILVSDEPDYYPKFEFMPAADYRIDWPGFLELERLQFYKLDSGGLISLQKTGLAFSGIAPTAKYNMKVFRLNLSVCWQRSFD